MIISFETRQSYVKRLNDSCLTRRFVHGELSGYNIRGDPVPYYCSLWDIYDMDFTKKGLVEYSKKHVGKST